jgi:hypothetical protein
MGKRGPKADSAEIRFWNRITKTDKCWLWDRPHKQHKYGILKVGKKLMFAHRFSWEIHNGTIPKDLDVLHRCDNPSCVNPEHLFLGTHQQNMKDRNNKGRQAFLKGSKNGQAILTEDQVIKIREFRSICKTPVKELANMFCVSVCCIEDILYNRSWRHI